MRSLRSFALMAQALLLGVSVALVAAGVAFEDVTIFLFGVFSLYLSNVIYACRDIRSRALFLFLHFGIFLFWLTRPFIALFYQTSDWQGSTPESTFFALGSIYLTMFFMAVGSELFALLGDQDTKLSFIERLKLHKLAPRRLDTAQSEQEEKVSWKICLRNASLFVYVVGAIASLMLGYQALSYMQGMLYEEYFLASVSDYSSVYITMLSSFAPYALCFYLATMPKRTPATIALLVNVITTVPFLLIGTRGNFVMSIVFLVFYYVVRNFLDGKGSWIGKREILLVAVGLPVGVLAMGLMNYLRAGSVIYPEGIIAQTGDALYKQGVTFKVLEYGYEVNPMVQSLGSRFFIFGSLINTVTQGFIGQLFLGCPLLPETNSVELALNGSYYSHAMSYFAHWNYLGGEGYGSAYTLELFADFGYVGIVVGSAFLGLVFALLSKNFGRSWFASVMALTAARGVFHMPRGEFTEWISYVWSTRFWLTFALVIVLAVALYFLTKRNGVKIVGVVEHNTQKSAPFVGRRLQPLKGCDYRTDFELNQSRKNSIGQASHEGME